MGDSLNITPYMEMFIGDAEVTDFSDSIVQQNRLWRKCGEFIHPGNFSGKGICWIRLTMQNTIAETYKRLLCFNDLALVSFYNSSGNIEQGGQLAPLREWSYASSNHCITLRLDSHQTQTFFIRCYKQDSDIERPLKFIIRSEQNENSFQSFEIKSRMADNAFLFFYLGFLSFCFIYFLVQFLFRLHERILLIYSLYLLFTLLYSFRDIDKHYFLQTAFPAFNGIYTWGEAIFSYLSYIFYLLFVLYLLNLKKQREWAYRLISSAIFIMALLLFCDIALRFTGNEEMAIRIFIKARMLIFPLVILYFLMIIPFWKGYYTYFLYGSIFLVLGTGINLLVFLIRDSPSFIFHEAISSKYGFWGNTVNYTRLGVLTEIVFFSLGLSKKIQVNYSQSAISKLKNNYISIIFHEIKNRLNTLIGLFKSNSNESINFIHKLSEILSDSLEMNEAKISLKDELIIAERYFNFRVKSNQKIDLKIINHAAESLDEVIVPPMLLQPFIENCLKHAFIDDKQEKKEITVAIIQSRNFVSIEIKDNGIGFKDVIVNKKVKAQS